MTSELVFTIWVFVNSNSLVGIFLGFWVMERDVYDLRRSCILVLHHIVYRFAFNGTDIEHGRQDYTVELAVELETAARLRASQFIFPQRPWLEQTNVNSPAYFLSDLYGINVRPVAPFGSASSKQFVDPALIHRVLPDELLFEILSKTTPYTLGRAACVCRKWRYTIRNPVFWRNACLKAWQVSGLVENYKVLQLKYDGSWRKMWLLRPRIRTDGIYVSRNTYIRAGVAEWKITNPVHLVCVFLFST
ncbi:hypothetical protein MTR67_047550 [Solanum verrucosum]|uniref:F-box protein n=1 Tax=Solanum verrucosum TaxID=315347 RepID=A0AAF0UY12_SOLVR|nr:hypothetical protein MTR67_047550 [Solanum verrucosum]